MCLTWLHDFCSFRNFLKFSCALLTLFLICQESFTFVVERPTTTSREEKVFDFKDIPEVVMCLEPGIDTTVLEKYGYKKVPVYFMGFVDGKFIGWNGNESEKKSSKEILEEALIVKNQHNMSTTFITLASYSPSSQQFVDMGIKLRMLAWPFGRCFSISPPSFPGNMSIGWNTLILHLNETALKDVHIRLYFMDRTSSLQVYPDENDMAGDPLDVPIHSDHKYIHRYKIKISRSQHIQGDPLMECGEYTQDKSYNDCIQNELFMSFENILGCH